MKGRIYDPLAARFTSADPILQAPFWSQGLNLYSYAFNNPINNTDPSGFDITDTVGAGFVVGGDAALAGGIYAGLGGTFGGLSAGAIGGGALGGVGNVAVSLLGGGPSLDGSSKGGTYAVTPSAAPAARGASRESTSAVAQNQGGVGAAAPRGIGASPNEPPPNAPMDARHGHWTPISQGPLDIVIRSYGQDIGCLLGECKSLLETTLAAARLLGPSEIRALLNIVGKVQMATSPDISVDEVAGKTPDEIDKLARSKGLIAKGPNPKAGQGAYVDPVTGKQRVLVHPGGASPHAHVNNPAGQRLGPDNVVVDPESPEAHIPIPSQP